MDWLANMTESNQFSTIFDHIPKSAGTTLRPIIEDVYSDDQICSIYQGNSMYLGTDGAAPLRSHLKMNFLNSTALIATF
jgi:hypothetical protein